MDGAGWMPRHSIIAVPASRATCVGPSLLGARALDRIIG
jgi:hypothetical protein